MADWGNITYSLARLSEQLLPSITTGSDSETAYVNNMWNRFSAEMESAMSTLANEMLADPFNQSLQNVSALLGQISATAKSRIDAWFKQWEAAKAAAAPSNSYYSPPTTLAPRYNLPDYNYKDYIVDYKSAEISEEELNQLFIDNIGGVELANIATFNTIFGNNDAYDLVRGLDRIDRIDDPRTSIVNITDSIYFLSLSIDLGKYFEETLQNPLLVDSDIVVEFDDSLPDDLFIEIANDSSGILYEMPYAN